MSQHCYIVTILFILFALFSLQGQFSEVQTKEFPGLAGIIGIY